MSKAKRTELIELIEKKRNSHVITYILSDRPNATANIAQDVVREIYELLCGLKPFKKKKLDLFLYSRGGDSNVPWQIVSMIREIFDEFDVLIPYRAHSAATMIAIGADSIIMGEKGELSPIDVTIVGPHNPKDPDTKERLPVSVEDVNGFFSLLEHLGKVKEERRIDAFLNMMEQVPSLVLGVVNRTMAQTILVATRLLETRNDPFSTEENEKIASKLSSEIFSHHHSISRTEAVKHIGLKQIKEAGELGPIFWELFTLYEQELKINDPFYPEDIMEQSDDEEMVFPDHKYIYLETTKRTRVFKLNVKMKKIREKPPNMNFNPQISFPTIEIPPQAKINQQAILQFMQQWLQGNVPGIINASFEQYKKEFPIIAYKRTTLQKQWIDE